MGLFSFKNTNKPKRFNHIPIYWDPEKEKREKREAKYSPKDNDEYKPQITRGSFRKYSDRLDIDKRAGENKRIIIKLVVILIGLIILAIYLIHNFGAIVSLYLDNSF